MRVPIVENACLRPGLPLFPGRWRLHPRLARGLVEIVEDSPLAPGLHALPLGHSRVSRCSCSGWSCGQPRPGRGRYRLQSWHLLLLGLFLRGCLLGLRPFRRGLLFRFATPAAPIVVVVLLGFGCSLLRGLPLLCPSTILPLPGVAILPAVTLPPVGIPTASPPMRSNLGCQVRRRQRRSAHLSPCGLDSCSGDWRVTAE
mmetsp:Transcript_47620/g.110307  ORF Transcript_47620/g.110307 Transcript_47620/m.110307 type:complete len:200 (+) Transcript_47620:158-757(+)